MIRRGRRKKQLTLTMTLWATPFLARKSQQPAAENIADPVDLVDRGYVVLAVWVGWMTYEG